MKISTFNQLLNHLLIEFRNGKVLNDDQMLTETHGYINGVENYTRCLINAVEKEIIPYLKNGENVYSENFSKAIFGDMKTFFYQCSIDVMLSKSNEVKYKGGYDARRSIFVKEGVGGQPLYFMSMNIQISAYSAEKMLEILRLVFAHELTHAWEDYNRRINGYSMDDYAKATKYYNTTYYTNNPNRNGQDALAQILNRLNKMERNAIIGQMKIELLSHKDDIKDSKTAMAAIRNTDAWGKYLYLERNVESLIIITSRSTDEADYWLQSFNEIMETNFKNIELLHNYLINKWTAWKNKFMNTVSKIAYDVYCQTVIYDDFTNNKEIYGTQKF